MGEGYLAEINVKKSMPQPQNGRHSPPSLATDLKTYSLRIGKHHIS